MWRVQIADVEQLSEKGSPLIPKHSRDPEILLSTPYLAPLNPSRGPLNCLVQVQWEKHGYELRDCSMIYLL